MIDALEWFPEKGIYHAGPGDPSQQTLGREGHRSHFSSNVAGSRRRGH